MFWNDNGERSSTTGMPFGGLQVVIILSALVLTALGAFTAGYVAARPAVAASPRAVLDEAWQIVDREFYYPKPSETERTYAAINGMLASLKDPHTVLLQPVAAARDEQVMQGQVGGVGAFVGQSEAGQLVITEVRRGWPAEQAGVRAGDVILAVDGKDVTGMALADAVNLIRGPLGTEVTLTVKRVGARNLLNLTMKRDQINVYGTMLDSGIAYISVDIFNQTAPRDVEKFLRDLLAQNPRALILDLRGNGGGFLNESLEIADMFLPEGLIATQRSSTGETKRYTSKDGGLAEQLPMVVLVDGRSASASEIVAGALKDRGRAALIGQRTFGKGSVQTLHRLSDGSQLRVTSGQWYTPNETPIRESIDGQPGGLQPNIVVRVPERPTPGVDPFVNAAIQYINGESEVF